MFFILNTNQVSAGIVPQYILYTINLRVNKKHLQNTAFMTKSYNIICLYILSTCSIHSTAPPIK